MTTIGPTSRQVAVKVSPEGDRLITSGAHYLRMSKKDLVEAAVEFYLNARREEMQAALRELLSQLDGSRAARVAMLAGMTREELEAGRRGGGRLADGQAGKAHAAVSGLAWSPAMSRTAGSGRLPFATGSTTLACGSAGRS